MALRHRKRPVDGQGSLSRKMGLISNVLLAQSHAALVTARHMNIADFPSRLTVIEGRTPCMKLGSTWIQVPGEPRLATMLAGDGEQSSGQPVTICGEGMQQGG